MREISVRKWATPLTIAAFALMSGTGVLMFFEYDKGITTVVHQWFSWIFLLGAGGHIVANWRPLKNHVATRWGSAAMSAAVVVFAASFFAWGMVTGPQLERPIEISLADASLSSLARLRRVSDQELVDRFAARGIRAAREDTLRDIAIREHVGINRLFGLVFDVG
jgi:hypothetical protein